MTIDPLLNTWNFDPDKLILHLRMLSVCIQLAKNRGAVLVLIQTDVCLLLLLLFSISISISIVIIITRSFV